MQALVDKDFRLRKTWQISLDELQLVLDVQRRPVILGKGASGTVGQLGPSFFHTSSAGPCHLVSVEQLPPT